jgi:hypothetical protein
MGPIVARMLLESQYRPGDIVLAKDKAFSPERGKKLPYEGKQHAVHSAEMDIPQVLVTDFAPTRSAHTRRCSRN